MITSEVRDFTLIIFRVISLMLLFVSVSLLLDQVFSQSANSNNNQHSLELSLENVLALITIVVASISWLIIIVKWIRNSHLELYLISIFIAKSVLILGLILIFISLNCG